MTEDAFADTDVPDSWPRETLEVGDLPPPKPLTETLETLGEMDPGTVLVQRNDRAPQHLYPKLEDRGFAHETVETDDDVVTAIWRP